MAVDFFHRLILFIAVIAIIIATLFSLVRAFLPWLPTHRALIENVIGRTIQQQVDIQHIDIGWTRAQPVLQLQRVTITDKQSHKPLLTLPEVDLQLDLMQSLWHKQIQFKRILIKRAELNLYQDTQQQWHLAGSEALLDFADQSHSNTATAFITWLLTIEHLQFSQFHIHVQAQRWPTFTMQSLSIDFNNHDQQHRLFGEAILQGPSPAPIRLALSMTGSASRLAQLDIQGYASLQDVDATPWLTQQSGLHWQQGHLTTKIWGHWQKNTWQRLQVQLQAQRVRLLETSGSTAKSLSSQDLTLHGTWQTPSLWQWQIDSHHGQIDFGTLFRQPITYDRIQAKGAYQSTTPAKLSLPYFVMTNPDIKLHAAVYVNWPTPDAPTIDLIAGADLLNLNHTSGYLPTGIMPPAVVKWLDNSVQGGSGGQVQMVLRGPIKHFPFKDHSGLMDIRGQLTGVHLAYWPGWPDIRDLNIQAQFTEQGMHIDADHGINGGIPISHIEAVIPHFAAPSTLQIKATTHSDLDKGVSFIRQSPLLKSLAALANSNSHGPFDFNLNLSIPLSHQDSTHWQGDLRLQDDQLSWPDYPVTFTHVQGRLLLSDTGVHSQALQTTLWNAIVPVDIQKSTTGPLHITGYSDVALKNLPSQWQYAFAQGHLPYHVTLALADHASHQASEFWLDSSLQGLAISLPLGFHKTAAIQTPVHLHGKLNDSGQIAQVTTAWQLARQDIRASYQRNPTGHNWRLTAPLIQGTLYTPQDTAKPWQIRIANLIWQSAPPSNTDSKISSIDPSHLPAMDIHADHVVFGQQSGTLTQMQIRPAASGLSIPTIKWQNALYQVTAHGQWNQQQTQFTGLLSTRKIQALLQSFSLPSFILAESSQFQFNVQWPGAPWQMALAKAQGHFTTKMSRGSLPSVGSDHAASMGFGKVLNLLSLNSLQQHLTLHFQDLTDQGFSFNQLNGTFDLNQGSLKIPKLTIAASLADVEAHGCLDLQQQNYQLALQIEPHLTSSLPVLATLAGGPIIGAIGLVANVIASPTISQITASHYALTGPWTNPQDIKYSSAEAAAAVLQC